MTEDWQTVAPLETEDPERRQRRPVDLVALIPGLIFIAVAVVCLTGVRFPFGIFRGGGVLWGALILAGVALLISELRKSRRR